MGEFEVSPVGRASFYFRSSPLRTTAFDFRRGHVVAGVCRANLVRGRDEIRPLGLRVVRGDAAALVAEQVLTIFERHASGAQASTERVLEVVDSHAAKAFGSGFVSQASKGPPPRVRRARSVSIYPCRPSLRRSWIG